MPTLARPILVAMLVFASAERVCAEPASRAKAADIVMQRKLARGHFERALAHYRQGHYREAVAELNFAVERDPESKDLFYNLAIVHEKMGELDPALANMQHYLSLETDPVEQARARFAIARMQGAKRVLEAQRANEELEMGRVDGWMLGASGLAVLGAVAGTVFGIAALVTAPGDEATDADTSIDDLHDQAERAHTFAVIADAAFAVSIASGAAAATLYFGRPRAGRDDLTPARSKPLAGLDVTLAVNF